ncbi:hypothetical protein ACFSF0_01100 [Ottowia flava]|uniref:Uncharacterized protein n=1 Tax=Ottowia flava TaxID=2675430 RepID=A0ABW4KPR3_9BURK
MAPGNSNGHKLETAPKTAQLPIATKKAPSLQDLVRQPRQATHKAPPAAASANRSMVALDMVRAV